MEHTPSPWVYESGEGRNIRAPDGGRIAQICHLRGWYGLEGRRNDEEVRANAHLIAAAPELLEVLKAICNGEWNVENDLLIFLAKAREIIAKAEGRE
jgi:hypothetical protein